MGEEREERGGEEGEGRGGGGEGGEGWGRRERERGKCTSAVVSHITHYS